MNANTPWRPRTLNDAVVDDYRASLQEIRAEVMALLAERDRYRAVLEQIASGKTDLRYEVVAREALSE